MDIPELKEKAKELRIDVVNMLAQAGSGHTAGALGVADVFTALFWGGILQYRASEPEWKDRDRLVLSNGHVCPILYASLAEAGFFDKEELSSLRQIGSRLQGHPYRKLGRAIHESPLQRACHATPLRYDNNLPGVEVTSGPLGQGFSVGVGMAMALKMDLKSPHIFIVSSDGEHDEGQTWEAILLAAKYRLFNLTVLLDRNKIQIGGSTEEVMPLESLKKKYEAFNWEVRETDGNDLVGVIREIGEIREIGREKQKPSVLICNTIPGKGVSFMEGDFRWHGRVPNKEEAERAIKELEVRR